MKRVKFLDCTIRDGSYAVNFSFSCREIEGIVKSLDEANVDFIEVGHGVGIGAHKKGFKKCDCSEEENILIALQNIKKAKWGMFAIPNICTIDDFKKYIDNGLRFVRIGFEPSKLSIAEKYIQIAKNSKITVFVNFMKSYTMPPKRFAQISKNVWDMGVDYVYLVDSAGGMLPEEVKTYIKAMKDKEAQMNIGFHGHNNLGLAVANSLAAIEEGAALIDVSLMGLGRGAGNTYFEQIVSVLIKKEYDIPIDLIKLMETSEKYLSKYMKKLYVSSIDVISGLALFHSSYMPYIKEISEKYKVDPKYLIMEVSKKEKIDITLQLVEETAKKLLKNKNYGEWYEFYKEYYGLEQ